MSEEVRKLLLDNKAMLAEVSRLERVIEGYIAVWDYLDPKGLAQEEEEFVELLKKYDGFYGGDEE